MLPPSLPAIVLLTLFVVPAVAAPKKPYAAVILPSCVAAGSAIVYRVADQRNLHPALGPRTSHCRPDSCPSPWERRHPGPRRSPVATVRLRNVSVAPGTSVLVSSGARVPCPLGTYTWSIIREASQRFLRGPREPSDVEPGAQLSHDQPDGHLPPWVRVHRAARERAGGNRHLDADVRPFRSPRERPGPRRERGPIPTSRSGHGLDPEQRWWWNAGGDPDGQRDRRDGIVPRYSIDKAGLGYTLSAGTTVAAIDAGLQAHSTSRTWARSVLPRRARPGPSAGDHERQ